MGTTINQRYLLIDTIRGIASFWILCFHVLPPYLSQFEHLVSFIKFGRIGTDFFFVTSGFVTAIACNNILQSNNLFSSSLNFLEVRFERIYTIYFFSLLTALFIIPILMGLVSFLKSGELYFDLINLSAKDFILYASLLKIFTAETWSLNTAFVEINGVYWFIATIVQIYAFIFIALRFKKHFVTILVSMFIFSLLTFYPPIKDIIPLGLFVPKFSEFFLGMALWYLICNTNETQTLILRNIFFIILIMGSISAIYLHITRNTGDIYRFVSAINVTALLYLLHPLDKKLSSNMILGFFRGLGKFSYSIYLNHIVFWPFMHMLVSNLIPLPLSISAPLFIVPMIIISSFVFYAFFERPANFPSSIRSMFSPITTIQTAFKTLKN